MASNRKVDGFFFPSTFAIIANRGLSFEILSVTSFLRRFLFISGRFQPMPNGECGIVEIAFAKLIPISLRAAMNRLCSYLSPLPFLSTASTLFIWAGRRSATGIPNGFNVGGGDLCGDFVVTSKTPFVLFRLTQLSGGQGREALFCMNCRDFSSAGLRCRRANQASLEISMAHSDI